VTIYRALNQGKQSPKMLAQVDKASESVFEAAYFNQRVVIFEVLIKSKFRLE